MHVNQQIPVTVYADSVRTVDLEGNSMRVGLRGDYEIVLELLGLP
jgi:hypothetical protein